MVLSIQLPIQCWFYRHEELKNYRGLEASHIAFKGKSGKLEITVGSPRKLILEAMRMNSKKQEQLWKTDTRNVKCLPE